MYLTVPRRVMYCYQEISPIDSPLKTQYFIDNNVFKEFLNPFQSELQIDTDFRDINWLRSHNQTVKYTQWTDNKLLTLSDFTFSLLTYLTLLMNIIMTSPTVGYGANVWTDRMILTTALLDLEIIGSKIHDCFFDDSLRLLTN